MMEIINDNNFKILILNENVPFRDLLVSKVKFLGFAVDIAFSGFQLMHLLDYNKDFHLIILNESMQDMGAVEIVSLTRINYSKEELPLIYISKMGTAEDIHSMISLGTNEYVLKSESIGPLITKINKYYNLWKNSN